MTNYFNVIVTSLILSLSTLGWAQTPSCPTCQDDAAQTQADAITPETYLGFGRAQNFSSIEDIQPDLTAEYHLPEPLALNAWAVGGPWRFTTDAITAESDKSVLRLHFNASKVFLVVSHYDGDPKEATLVLNGAPPGTHSGDDALDGHLVVDDVGIYEILNVKSVTEGLLEIQVDTPGLQIQAFVFS
jgi:hypothetical protein